MNKIKIIFVKDNNEDFLSNVSVDKDKVDEICRVNSFEGNFKESLILPSFLVGEESVTIILGIDGVNSQEDSIILGAITGNYIDSDVDLELVGNLAEVSIEKFYLGIKLSQYNFDEYKEEKSTKYKIKLDEFDNTNEIEHIVESVDWVKDQINRPSLDKSPKQFVESVQTFVNNIELNIYDSSWMEENSFGGVLGVGRGSEREPFFLEGLYNTSSEKQIALIGKGVMFDSGGLSLKSPSGMDTMKTDMSGAATVWGVANLISKMDLDIGIRVLTPLVENMPSGSAIRPGDVLTLRNKKTIEVLNTDAEGRLIMADALAYAAEQKPYLIIDVATLTGASKVALGPDIGVSISNSKEHEQSLIRFSQEFSEIFSSLPLHQGYKSLIESDIADMKNTGGRWGGAITAALILEEFIEDSAWIHLDIAGPARSSDNDLVRGKGATGFGVMGIYNYIKNIN